MKHNHTLTRITLMMLLFRSIPATAQFKLIDEQDGKPVAGAYIFSNTGSLLCVSSGDGSVKKLDGTVTISDLAYETKTVDASKTSGTVSLSPKAYTLPNVMVNRAEYVKLSGAFRDICRNNGKTILYREGLSDFYINMKTGKIKRRVRACRQYEIPGLRKLVNFNIAILGEARSTNLSRIRYIKRDSMSGISGDSTFYKSHYGGKTTDSAIIYIDTHRSGVYRHIIDNTKYRRSNNMMHKTKVNLCDWTFTSKKETWSTLVSFRKIYNYDYKPLPTKEFIAAEEMSDYVVTGVCTLTGEQAQTEMKDRNETADFTLPDCLPTIPYDIAKETQELVRKKFWEM